MAASQTIRPFSKLTELASVAPLRASIIGIEPTIGLLSSIDASAE